MTYDELKATYEELSKTDNVSIIYMTPAAFLKVAETSPAETYLRFPEDVLMSLCRKWLTYESENKYLQIRPFVTLFDVDVRLAEELLATEIVWITAPKDISPTQEPVVSLEEQVQDAVVKIIKQNLRFMGVRVEYPGVSVSVQNQFSTAQNLRAALEAALNIITPVNQIKSLSELKIETYITY